MIRAVLRLGVLLLPLVLPISAAAQSAPTPEDHFGFAMGTSGELARWDGILEYFEILGDASDRVRIDTLGPTTLGNPFVVITMTAPANLRRLDEIHEASATLAEGRVPEAEARRLAADLPATVFINHNIHSTEIGSSQTSVDLVHRLATATDPETLAVLDNVVTILIPSANPDGQIMVTDWYYRIRDSETPAARMPYLYHHYAGHDNNRDFFQGALVETRYWFDVMFNRSAAQIYLDQHQMGGNGARMFVPPYPDPMNPLVHPLVWQGTQFVGGGIVRDLQAAGMQGVLNGRMYRIFGQEGALTQRFHNVIGLLTETASSNLASPDTVTLAELEGSARRLGPGAKYEFSMGMPDPWWGGEWTIGDIVEYQTVAAMSVLRQAAAFNTDYVLGRWQMARETMERAEASGPFALVIPADQNDPLTALDLMRRLSWQGIEVHRATEAFEAVPAVLSDEADVAGIRKTVQQVAAEAEAREAAARAAAAAEEEDEGDTGDEEDEEEANEDAEEDEEADADDAEEDEVADTDMGSEEDGMNAEPRRFEAGSWVVRVAQPGRAAVMDLLEPRFLPIRNEYPGGPFLRMYDAAAYTMSMQMGVETVRIDDPFEADLEEVTAFPAAEVVTAEGADRWYSLDPRLNDSYRAANGLLSAGMRVHRASNTVELDGEEVRGAFLIPADQQGLEAALLEHAGGVPVYADPDGAGASLPLTRSRIGLYQGWASSMDEGWTRLMLEEYGFDFRTLSNEDVRDDDLAEHVDVVVLPSEISLSRLMDGADEDDAPEEYVGGIGEEGVDNLREFVRSGGTLVTLDRGDAVVLEHFDVPIRDALEGVESGEFFLPASLLNLDLDTGHDLSMGSPDRVLAKWAGGRAYEPTGWDGESGGVRVVGRWASEADDVLAAGQLVGAEYLADKGAILDVAYGNGRILMYGFRVQHRMQTHGTFKLLFNALMTGTRRPAM